MPPILTAYIQAIAHKYLITEDAAFEVLSAAVVLDKPFDEVYQDVWVGSGDDCGFDAVYIDDQANIINLFQSKNSPGLSENYLMKLITDLDDLFISDNRSARNINPRLRSLVEEYKEFTKQGIVLTPKLFFVYSGTNNDKNHPNNARLSARFSTRGVVPEYLVLDSADLVSRISNLQRERRNRVDFTFNPLETNIASFSRQALYSFTIAQVTGASFRIEAIQLCQLIEKEISVNGLIDTLFSENIRGYLGRNKANKRILETLKDRNTSRFFPFMNNGLTIVCENISIPTGPQANIYNIPVVNPLIVNGLQTTRVIYDIYKEDKTFLDGVYITLKVYESRNHEFTDLITEATNTQTSINFKDQMSNKSFNEKARVLFASRGVRYISKRGEIVRGDDLSAGLQDSVNNELVLKFWYATFNKDPYLAKTSRNSLLENIFLATKGEHTNANLNQLFNGDAQSLLYEELFTAYKIQKLVAEKRIAFMADTNLEYLLHADELISYGIYLELENNGNIVGVSDVQLKQAYAIVQPRIGTIVDAEKTKRGEAYSHTRYFKSDGLVQDYDQLI